MDIKETRAKSLEIAALIKGSSNEDSPLDKYQALAGEIASYINTNPPGTEPKSSVGFVKYTGI
jgi:hypothetical protein